MAALKQYKIVSYSTLVKAGRYDLEPVEGSTKPVVEEAYRVAVAEYLIAQQ